MNRTITIIVPINAKPEFRAEIRRRLLELAGQTRKEPGNINYILHESDSDPNLFAIYEKWQDQAALHFHMGQPYLKAFLTDTAEMLQKPIHGTICRVFEA